MNAGDLLGLYGPRLLASLVVLLCFGIVHLAALVALSAWRVNVGALVAGLGLTGFALGFALKDVLSNLLAGVLILLYRPFQRGHRVSVTGFEGIVAEINLRYTTLDSGGKKILIPNSLLLNTPSA